jgi:Protein of unknown function (DUF1566)/Carboxypeptidase regulatory-like domain
MRKIKLMLALVGSGVVYGCGGGGGGTNSFPSSGVATAKVSGTVVDKNGVPESGVTISVFHHNDHTTVTTTTDINGNYSIAGLSTGINSDYAMYAGKSGRGFYPSGSDSAGAVNKFDFNGLYRTVMRFATLPARDIVGSNFTAYRSGDHLASLPRTGQTSSYVSGDDYSALSGVAWPGTRFTDNADGTVTDHLTGLVWLKNAACFSPTNWSAALTAANQLVSGTCGLSDGSTASQWRMPNVNELESLVDVSQTSPAVSAGHPFSGIATAYWSSTTYTASSSNAMVIRFTDGRWINGPDGGENNDKATSNNSLWAVKSGGSGAIQLLATGVYAGVGGASFGTHDDASLQLGVPLTSPRFIDNGDGTVSDTVTGLLWLKQADCIINLSWSAAISAVNTLANGRCGLSDGSTAGQWRMPNRTEMLSLSDRAPTFPQADYFKGIYPAAGPVIFTNFVTSVYYWTSTTEAADTTQAWTVYSCDFGVYNLPKAGTGYTLAVR